MVIQITLVAAVVVVGKHNFFSRYFGIQFYGECWGDVEAEARYAMHGEVDRKHSEQNCIEGEIQNLPTFSSLKGPVIIYRQGGGGRRILGGIF